MRIYLAARFILLDKINSYADKLRERGHIVDCKWLLGFHQLHPGATEVEASGDNVPLEARPFAEDDIEDINNSEILILFSEKPFSDKGRGGRHVEFGYALGLGKKIYVVGPRENVFHCLKQVKQFNTFEELERELENAN